MRSRATAALARVYALSVGRGAAQGRDGGGRGGAQPGQRQGGVVAHTAVRIGQAAAERGHGGADAAGPR